ELERGTGRNRGPAPRGRDRACAVERGAQPRVSRIPRCEIGERALDLVILDRVGQHRCQIRTAKAEVPVGWKETRLDLAAGEIGRVSEERAGQLNVERGESLGARRGTEPP